jgi:hypothetical protein
MTYAEAAEVLWRIAMEPITESVVDHRPSWRAAGMRPLAAKALMRWCDGIDFGAIDPEEQYIALVMLSEVVIAWAKDRSPLAAYLQGPTPETTARNALRVEIRRSVGAQAAERPRRAPRRSAQGAK